MNRDEQFENRLRKIPQRPIPAAWREDILTAARAAASAQRTPARTHGALRDALIQWLWPHPAAWAGLAAAWVLIFGLSVAGRDPAQAEFARRAAPPSPELRELLRQQEQVLAELTEPSESARTAPAQPPTAQPRSERREDLLNA